MPSLLCRARYKSRCRQQQNTIIQVYYTNTSHTYTKLTVYASSSLDPNLSVPHQRANDLSVKNNSLVARRPLCVAIVLRGGGGGVEEACVS